MNSKFLWIVFLIAILVGGAVWGKRLFTGHPDPAKRFERALYFRCTACGETFTRTPAQLGEFWKDRKPPEGVGYRIDCVKCSKAFTAFETTEADHRKGALAPNAITPPDPNERRSPPPAP